MSFEDYLEEVHRKARSLVEPYMRHEKVSVREPWMYKDGLVLRVLTSGFDISLSDSEYFWCEPPDENWFTLQCNGKDFNLKNHFQDILNPTEIELEEFELESGYPFLFTEEGLKSIVDIHKGQRVYIYYDVRSWGWLVNE